MRGIACDKRAASRKDRNQTSFAQYLDSFADRRPTHAELLGESTLGGESISRLELARSNGVLNLLDDVLMKS